MATKGSKNKTAWTAKDVYEMLYSTYGRSHAKAIAARKKEASKYTIPYIPEKEIMLTTGRYNTGKISTNLLDSIYNAAKRTNTPIDIALGLAGRESTLGIGRGFKRGQGVTSTDLYSNWQQVQPIPNTNAQVARYNEIVAKENAGEELTDEDYQFKSDFIMRGQNALENTKVIKENPIDNALKFYQTGKYNPGDKRHSQMVEEDARILMSDPAIQKWLQTKNNNQMKCGGRRKAQLGLDIQYGGRAIPIARNMVYFDGNSHSAGGIGVGNDLEVEGGEVGEKKGNTLRIFSAVPFLGGASPAQLVIGGANPNVVFKAQEAFKDKNRIKDDGTHYQNGGNKVIKYENLPSSFKGKRVNGRILQGGVPPVLSRGELAMGNPIQRMSMWTDDLGEFSKYMARRIHKFVPKKVDKAYRYVVEYFDDKGPNNAINNNAENLTKAVSLFNAHEYKYGGNMIYEINGNVKNGLMSVRPKAQYGKQRKVEGYGNTIVVDDDTFMLNDDGVYVPIGNVQINKQPKTVRGASSRRDIAYDRQGNRYQRRSDGSLIRVSPEKGNIAVSDTIRGVEVNTKNLNTVRNRRDISKAAPSKLSYEYNPDYPSGSVKGFIRTLSNVPETGKKANPPRQKVEPNFEIGDQTVVNFLRNSNGRYNTQRTPIHSFTPAQKLGLSSYGWSTYNDPNKGYTFREDATAVRAGQKSLDEIISQDLSQINFDDNQLSSTPRRGETKATNSKAATNSKSSTKGADTKYDVPLAEKKESLYMTGIKNNIATPIKTGMEKIKSPSSTGGGKQSNSDGRWIPQFNSITTRDWIGLGSNLAGHIASYFTNNALLSKYPMPTKPVMAQAAKLKTTYNINPELTNNREVELTNRGVVRRNTQSSNTSIAREQRIMNEARNARNQLYSRKENIETQLINQDRLNRQSVYQRNVAAYNDWLDKTFVAKNNKLLAKQQNMMNLISGIPMAVNNIIGNIESRQATNNTIKAIAAVNPNVDGRLLGIGDYYTQRLGDGRVAVYDKNGKLKKYV